MPASDSGRSADAHHGGGVTYAGLTLHKPARWHVLWGTGMSALMWYALRLSSQLATCCNPYILHVR